MINILKGKQMKKSVALILIGIIWIASMISARALSREVEVNVDSSQIVTRSFSSETDKILNQVGVKLKPNDSVDRYDEESGRLKLDVKRAFDVSVTKDGKKIMLRRSSGTVKNILDDLDVSAKDRENLNYDESQTLFPNIDILVGKKFDITVNVDGESRECSVPEGTVSQALDCLGVKISSEDLVDADLSSNVFDGMHLTISRITYREIKKTEDIPFRTETKVSGLLNGSERQISRKGKSGSKELVIRETLKDGVVVDSKELGSKVLSEPVNELILVGNTSSQKKNNLRSEAKVDSKPVSGSPRGEQCVCGSATAYTAAKGARTATGAIPVEGVTIAVDPKVIPYGSQVRIETNDGKVLCSGKAQDTGSQLRKGNAVVDIYMSSTSKCIKFGRKNVKVYYKP